MSVLLALLLSGFTCAVVYVFLRLMQQLVKRWRARRGQHWRRGRQAS